LADGDRLGRVLVIARDFPPASGAPAIRIAKLAKYLGEFGWTPTVVTAPIDHAWDLDISLEDDLASGLAVWRTPRLLSTTVAPKVRQSDGGRATAGSSLPRRLVAKLCYPDPSLLWAIPAARRATKLGRNQDAIITSGPPFSTHLVGLWVSRRLGLPWVADYRDNWSGNPATGTHPVRHRLDRLVDSLVLKTADAVTVVSRAAAIELQDQLGVPPTRLFIALNGFDVDDLPASPGRSKDFLICYAGSLDERRDIRPLLAALQQAGRRSPDLARDLHLSLIGRIPDWAGEAALRDLGSDRVAIGGLRPHREALAEASAAAVLLVLSSTAEAGGATMTSKLLECLGLRRPVLMLAPSGPGVDLVTELGAGESAMPDDVPAIEEAVLRLYGDWRSGLERVADPAALIPLTRRVTGEVFASALDAAVRSKRRLRRDHGE
jgi:glycosyltransferase involved in cell wall biosynthesis